MCAGTCGESGIRHGCSSETHNPVCKHTTQCNTVNAQDFQGGQENGFLRFGDEGDFWEESEEIKIQDYAEDR